MEEISAQPLQLRALGFCGADDSVSPELLILLSQNYPFVEWGILFRPDLEGTPRYASWNWTTKLCKLVAQATPAPNDKLDSSPSPMRLAAHLCGSRCQDVLDGNSKFVSDLKNLGFGRVQVNATKANNVTINHAMIAETVLNIRKCMEAVPAIEWILQYNEETRCICDGFLLKSEPNMSILYDSSCGLGIQMKEFPKPVNPDILYGYAGGIGPKTIKEMISKIHQVSHSTAIWIDMETNLRTKVVCEAGGVQDIFSIEKCFECIMIASDYLGIPRLNHH
jgi:hypothetical protein